MNECIAVDSKPIGVLVLCSAAVTERSLPLRGANNPSTQAEGTSPGSFANAPDIGGAYTFSSPDTPGMPPPSDKTAWDFMPSDWKQIDGKWVAPEGFEPVTQLEHARLGIVTKEIEPNSATIRTPTETFTGFRMKDSKSCMAHTNVEGR